MKQISRGGNGRAGKTDLTDPKPAMGIFKKRKLTKRYIEVGDLVYAGYLTKQIAGKLNVTERCANYHRERLYLCLGVHTVVEFVKAWHAHPQNIENRANDIFLTEIRRLINLKKSISKLDRLPKNAQSQK